MHRRRGKITLYRRRIRPRYFTAAWSRCEFLLLAVFDSVIESFFSRLDVRPQRFRHSEAPRDASYTLKSQADLVALFLTQQNLARVNVVGNSLGGAIAAELAIRHPQIVKSLILINSAHDPNIIKLKLRPFKKLIPIIAPMVNKHSLRYYMGQLYGTTMPLTAKDIVMYLAPYRSKNLDRHFAFYESFDSLLGKGLAERMKKIKAPILIIWGKNDKIIPLRFGTSLHKTLPESDLRIHPTAGHHLQEEDPVWLTKEIRNFLTQN